MGAIYLWDSLIKIIKLFSFSGFLGCAIVFNLSSFINSVVLQSIGGTALGIFLLAEIVSLIRSRRKISPAGKAVLISGCDRGFGHLLARRLDDLGFKVFAGCLFPDGQGAMDLRNLGSCRMHVFGLDVTKDKSIEEALDFVERNLKECKLWAVVNNAGVIDGCELIWTGIEKLQKLIDVNTFGFARISMSFSSMIKESKGRILVVSSAAGRATLPYLGPYCVSKRATTAFCDGLRQEMTKWDINVINIEPTIYKTSFLDECVRNAILSWKSVPAHVKQMYEPNHIDKISSNFSFFMRHFSHNPSDVVSTMEKGIMDLHPECTYVVGGLISRLIIWMAETLPSSVVVCITQLLLKLAEVFITEKNEIYD